MSTGDGVPKLQLQLQLNVVSHGAFDLQRYAAAEFLLVLNQVTFFFFFATQKHAVDFYISDFQSGLRALVKAGYGARVTPYVDESVVIDVDPLKKDAAPPEFIQWLGEMNLSSLSDRPMRLKEG